MFARTPRLLLRPGFPEDAPALVTAIADETIVRNLAGQITVHRSADGSTTMTLIFSVSRTIAGER